MSEFIFIFIISAIILVPVIILSVFLVKRGNNDFNQKKREGIAVIVGHDSESTSSHIVYSVRVLDSGDNKTYNLKGVYNVKKPNGELDERYPHFNIGDTVHVLYASRCVAGIHFLEVRLNRSRYNYPE